MIDLCHAQLSNPSPTCPLATPETCACPTERKDDQGLSGGVSCPVSSFPAPCAHSCAPTRCVCRCSYGPKLMLDRIHMRRTAVLGSLGAAGGRRAERGEGVERERQSSSSLSRPALHVTSRRPPGPFSTLRARAPILCSRNRCRAASRGSSTRARAGGEAKERETGGRARGRLCRPCTSRALIAQKRSTPPSGPPKNTQRPTLTE